MKPVRHERPAPITLSEEDIGKLLSESRMALSKIRLSESGAADFMEAVSDIMQYYRKVFPEDTEVRYRLRKRLGRIQLDVVIRGERKNPLEEGKWADNHAGIKLIRPLSGDQNADVYCNRLGGRNIVTVFSPSAIEAGNLLKQPMIVAVILGVVLGLVFQLFPAEMTGSLVDDVTGPVLNIILKVIAGIMGPLVFLSLVLAISSLDDICELSSWGRGIFRRFFLITAAVTVISAAVAIVMFPILGKGSVSFRPRMITDLILDVIPVNLFRPFVDNDVPQLVMLAILLGTALLLISGRITTVIPFLTEVRDWLSEAMRIIMKVMPAVPFLSVFNLIAMKETDSLLRGWKYIAASYICLLICIVFKLIKVSIRCGVPVPLLLKRVKPVALAAGASGSGTAVIEQFKEASRKDFGVDEKFLAFWFPMNQAMLTPTGAIGYVLAPFYVAELTGTTVSAGFLVILLIMTVQLSLASPGFTAGCTILFEALSLPAGYVGLFSAFGVFVRNSAVACETAFCMLENFEAAHAMGMVRPDEKKGGK